MTMRGGEEEEMKVRKWSKEEQERLRVCQLLGGKTTIRYQLREARPHHGIDGRAEKKRGERVVNRNKD
jgi:hypothetical protein